MLENLTNEKIWANRKVVLHKDPENIMDWKREQRWSLWEKGTQIGHLHVETEKTVESYYTIRKDCLEKLTLTGYLSKWIIEFRQKKQTKKPHPGYFWKITFVRQAIFIIIVFDKISIQSISNRNEMKSSIIVSTAFLGTAYTLQETWL